MKAWKICRIIKNGNIIESMFGDNGHNIQYKLNEKVIPYKKCGPLAAFDCIESAKIYLTSSKFIVSDDFCIYECNVEILSREEREKMDSLARGLAFWCITDATLSFDEISGIEEFDDIIPRGTIYCKSITLLAKV